MIEQAIHQAQQEQFEIQAKKTPAEKAVKFVGYFLYLCIALLTLTLTDMLLISLITEHLKHMDS